MPNIQDSLLGNVIAGSGYAKAMIADAPIPYEPPPQEYLWMLGSMLQDLERMRVQAASLRLKLIENRLNDIVEEISNEWLMRRRDIRSKQCL